MVAEQQRLLARWEPELERLKAKDAAARERAEERDQDYPEDLALEELDAFIDEMNGIDVDDIDPASFTPLLVLGAGS